MNKTPTKYPTSRFEQLMRDLPIHFSRMTVNHRISNSNSNKQQRCQMKEKILGKDLKTNFDLH